MIAIGDMLDEKYLVRRRLGSGGFGEVYLADDSAISGRKVAIKVLARPASADHSDLLWEMQNLARFAHPGIVTFYHHFTSANRLYLVMEFCAGGSLDDQLAQGGRHAEADVIGWGIDLSETLAFVHEQEIVHHDVKPANVLFAADGRIKVGDFGVANRNTGTRMYLPPEMLLGEQVSRTDPRIDIYALGLTLLESLTGVQPFERMSAGEALQAKISHAFVPSTLPRWQQEVFIRATHPTPELRFQTMREFSEALTGRRVIYVFDGNRIKAHKLAEEAEKQLARKKWESANRLVTSALRLSPDCVAALLAAGRCHLLIRRIEQAREYFSQALSISPRTHVQKELGWLSLEEGRLPAAISMLTDHLQRESSDYEAYNLLLKCFYLSDRYEAGADLARAMMEEKPLNECFINNGFLCRLLNGELTAETLHEAVAKAITPFTAYNLAVATEAPRAWNESDRPVLKSKLLFEEYRFGNALRAGKENKLEMQLADGARHESVAPIVALGSLPANDVVLDDRLVSRRHALLVNYPNDVWLYDLSSTNGTSLDDQAVIGPVFIEGVHELVAGGVKLRVAARAGLLV